MIVINQILNVKSELSSINEMLFTIYCGVITGQFAEILLSEDDNIPEGLVGVENNE